MRISLRVTNGMCIRSSAGGGMWSSVTVKDELGAVDGACATDRVWIVSVWQAECGVCATAVWRGVCARGGMWSLCCWQSGWCLCYMQIVEPVPLTESGVLSITLPTRVYRWWAGSGEGGGELFTAGCLMITLRLNPTTEYKFRQLVNLEWKTSKSNGERTRISGSSSGFQIVFRRGGLVCLTSDSSSADGINS